jgi:hypothetical protein
MPAVELKDQAAAPGWQRCTVGAPKAVAAEALVAVAAVRSGRSGVQLARQLRGHQVCGHLAADGHPVRDVA